MHGAPNPLQRSHTGTGQTPLRCSHGQIKPFSFSRHQMRALAVLLAAFVSFSACAQSHFASFALTESGARLEIRDQSGSVWNAPKPDGHVGFQSPKIAHGGRYAGWLALAPNCCTSYPIPLALMVLDTRGQLHEFKGPQATFGWCFELGGTAVAYKRELLHGATPELFELRRIQDGALLRRFEVPVEVSTGEAPMPTLPKWAACAARDAAGASQEAPLK
jgi:hypothetical protein